MLHFLKGAIPFLFSQIIGGRKYNDWKRNYFSLKKIEISNKKLAKELEESSRNSFLTFGEYLNIDQFGKYGYHATHKNHGQTPTFNEWGKTIAFLCKQYGFHNVLDFGCGTGELGINLLRAAEKSNIKLSWSGVEVQKKLHKEIQKRFQKQKLDKYITSLTDSIEKQKFKNKTLVVLSYSLDSVSPEMFINTTSEKHFPNALIGVNIKNGILTEKILAEKDLKKKKISLSHGLLKVGSRIFDISSWKLNPYQRAFIPISAFSILSDLISSLPKDSLLLIMDEFQISPKKGQSNHFCMPKDLAKLRREYINVEEIYKEAGESLLYYPFYLQTLLNFLSKKGCNNVKYDIEQRMTYSLRNEVWKEKPGFYTVYAVSAFLNDYKKLKTIPLLFPNHVIPAKAGIYTK